METKRFFWKSVAVGRGIRGFGLVEMLVGTAVLSVSLLAISSFFQSIMRANRGTQASIQADYLLEEGVEVVKIFRDTTYTDNFLKMSTTTPYFFLWNGTVWATSTVNTLVDSTFERSFTLGDVQRDINNDIASSGNYDPNIKLVTVSVSWMTPLGTTTRSLRTYVTNIFNN